MIKEKKPFYKRWWFILIVAVFIINILGNVFESDESKQKKEDEKIAAEQDDEQKEQKAKEDKEKKEQDKKEEEERLASRSISETLEEDDNNVDKATLKDGLLTIESEPGALWDENSLFRTVYDLFESMHEAFKDESVDEVEAIIQTTMTDQKGNESLDPVIEYIYTRESFEELNYDNFSNMAYSEQWRILNEADVYVMHPGIYKNLKDKYTDNLPNGISKFPPIE